MRVRKGEAAFDAWSYVHFASGVALAVVGLRPLLAVAAILVHEVIEAGLRRVKTKGGKGLFEYESWANIGADLVLGVGAYFLVHAIWPGLWPFGW